MTLKDAREAYYDYSGKLSEITRQLSFAGIAVVWIFRTGDKTAAGIGWSHFLLWPLGSFVIALVADVLHYSYATVAWGSYHSCKEKEFQALELSATDLAAKDFKAPRAINYPTDILLGAKAVACAIGHLLLLIFLARALCK